MGISASTQEGSGSDSSISLQPPLWDEPWVSPEVGVNRWEKIHGNGVLVTLITVVAGGQVNPRFQLLISSGLFY